MKKHCQKTKKNWGKIIWEKCTESKLRNSERIQKIRWRDARTLVEVIRYEYYWNFKEIRMKFHKDLEKIWINEKEIWWKISVGKLERKLFEWSIFEKLNGKT